VLFDDVVGSVVVALNVGGDVMRVELLVVAHCDGADGIGANCGLTMCLGWSRPVGHGRVSTGIAF